jgi:cellulose synthase/poly-beta-1,6-N-acetylglucosamine synthase-like glycosyltransferase
MTSRAANQDQAEAAVTTPNGLVADITDREKDAEIGTGPAQKTEVVKPAPPFVSVIVPVYNDFDGLRQCLRALEEQTYPSDRYEVIVVDNGSSRPIEAVAGDYGHARVEREAQPGSYAARNRGLAAARGEVLAFTDADCRPEPAWLAEGVAALEADEECGLVAGDIQVVARDSRAPTAVEYYELTYGFRQAFYVTEGFGATANLFTRRAVVDVVGGFDARLKSCGDREWGMRVRDAGYRLSYAEGARVLHPARRTWGELVKKTARVSGGMFELARIHGEGRGYSVLVVLSELKPPMRQALRVFQGDGPPGIRARLSVIAALTLRRWITAFEWLRLEAGSAPRR